MKADGMPGPKHDPVTGLPRLDTLAAIARAEETYDEGTQARATQEDIERLRRARSGGAGR